LLSVPMKFNPTLAHSVHNS